MSLRGLEEGSSGAAAAKKFIRPNRHKGATGFRSQRPRETDPCGEGSWIALMGTASVTILQSVLGKGVWEHSHEQESAPLYVKPEWPCSSKPNVSLQFGKDFSL